MQTEILWGAAANADESTPAVSVKFKAKKLTAEERREKRLEKADKPVKRETRASYRGRPLVIEVCASYVKIRLKGYHTAYTVTMDQIFNLGARNAAEALRKERAEAKKNRKKGIFPD